MSLDEGTANHLDKDGQRTPCDRHFLEGSIRLWFGSVAEFDILVQRQVRAAFERKLGGFPAPYSWVIGAATPIAWSSVYYFIKLMTEGRYAMAIAELFLHRTSCNCHRVGELHFVFLSPLLSVNSTRVVKSKVLHRVLLVGSHTDRGCLLGTHCQMPPDAAEPVVEGGSGKHCLLVVSGSSLYHELSDDEHLGICAENRKT